MSVIPSWLETKALIFNFSYCIFISRGSFWFFYIRNIFQLVFYFIKHNKHSSFLSSVLVVLVSEVFIGLFLCCLSLLVVSAI